MQKCPENRKNEIAPPSGPPPEALYDSLTDHTPLIEGVKVHPLNQGGGPKKL